MLFLFCQQPSLTGTTLLASACCTLQDYASYHFRLSLRSFAVMVSSLFKHLRFIARHVQITTSSSFGRYSSSLPSLGRCILVQPYPGLLAASQHRQMLFPTAHGHMVALFSQIPDQDAGPTAIDYQSLLTEDEFHKLADGTIHDLQEKLEEYGDEVQIDGFDVDYGNQVLTIKLGNLGTYVINKQTPNRQIWLSSPVSGPSRFDWDRIIQTWVYRRTKAKLVKLLEEELEQLCGRRINLSD